MNIFPTFHVSLLKAYRYNSDDIFPGRKLEEPGPMVSADGEQRWFVEKILDRQRRGRGYRYLVRWKGFGPKDDSWISGVEAKDLAALDIWEQENGIDNIAFTTMTNTTDVPLGTPWYLVDNNVVYASGEPANSEHIYSDPLDPDDGATEASYDPAPCEHDPTASEKRPDSYTKYDHGHPLRSRTSGCLTGFSKDGESVTPL
jgi:hypothetical protein